MPSRRRRTHRVFSGHRVFHARKSHLRSLVYLVDKATSAKQAQAHA